MNEYKFMKSARYLQAEIPVRIAHRIRDFQNLPFIVACNPYLIEVQNLYLNSFHKLMDLPTISSDEEEVEFTNLLSRLVDEHVHVPDLLGQGVKECRRYITPGELDHFLNRTLRGRIGMRVLAEQHINLKNSRNGFIGIINTRLRPQDIIQRAWLHAQDVCRLHYGDAPHLTIDGHEDATFSFIPVHLEYIMIELFKNSMRATVEFHRDSDKLPPVRVTLCKGDRDVTIRVSDQGGGIPYDIVNKVWQYAFTTALESMQSGLQGTSLISDAIARKIEPIAGIGFGLPQSKVYAEYFGGDLQLHTMHGYGTDMYLRLNHIGNICEHVEI